MTLTQQIAKKIKLRQIVYLKCDSEDVVAKIVPDVDNIFVRFSHAREYSIKSSTDLAMTITTGSVLITKEEYDSF